MAEAKRDNNRVTTVLAEDAGEVGTWKADHVTGYALIVVYPETIAPSGEDGDAIRDNNRVTVKLAEDENSTVIGPWKADTNQYAYITLS